MKARHTARPPEEEAGLVFVDGDDCWASGGEGWIDRYEEDPPWYGPDDLWRCEECGGRGVLPRAEETRSRRDMGNW